MMEDGQHMHWAWLPVIVLLGWITVALFAVVVYFASWIVLG